MEMMLRHQQIMLALRQEMGLPLCRLVNDSMSFASGQPSDFEVGMELGRVATMLNRDVIYSGWSSTGAREPSGFTIALRGMLTVDIIDNLVPFAAADDAPIALVSTREDELFQIDSRGSLTRGPGKPKALRKGRELAMRRIKAAAATMRGDLLPGNRHVPWGAESVPSEAGVAETIVRFG